VSTTEFALLAVASFVAMEPITAATHRWVMHGLGSRLHRSHHRPPGDTRWEDNDVFPIVFASIVMLGFWFGFHRDSLAWLVPAGIGVTIYGAAYAIVHDGYIHRRVAIFGGRRLGVLDRLADAHRVHHRSNGAPFGMLVPIVPSETRAGSEAAPHIS
jgi:beta-carotene 3-hydroxylase